MYELNKRNQRVKLKNGIPESVGKSFWTFVLRVDIADILDIRSWSYNYSKFLRYAEVMTVMYGRIYTHTHISCSHNSRFT